MMAIDRVLDLLAKTPTGRSASEKSSETLLSGSGSFAGFFPDETPADGLLDRIPMTPEARNRIEQFLADLPEQPAPGNGDTDPPELPTWEDFKDTLEAVVGPLREDVLDRLQSAYEQLIENGNPWLPRPSEQPAETIPEFVRDLLESDRIPDDVKASIDAALAAASAPQQVHFPATAASVPPESPRPEAPRRNPVLAVQTLPSEVAPPKPLIGTEGRTGVGASRIEPTSDAESRKVSAPQEVDATPPARETPSVPSVPETGSATQVIRDATNSRARSAPAPLVKSETVATTTYAVSTNVEQAVDAAPSLKAVSGGTPPEAGTGDRQQPPRERAAGSRTEARAGAVVQTEQRGEALERDANLSQVAREAGLSSVRQETHIAPAGAAVNAPSPTQQIASRLTGEAARLSQTQLLHALSGRPSSTPAIKTMQIKLEPDGLGVVTVKLALVNDNLSVDVAVASDELSAQLRSERDALASVLTQAGYTIDGITVQNSEADKAALQRIATLVDPSSSQGQSSGSASGGSQAGVAGDQRGQSRGEGTPGQSRESQASDHAPADAPRGPTTGAIYL